MPNGMTGGMPFYDMNTNMSEFEDLHDEQALISRLLWNYDPAARPVYNASHPVIVKFSFALIQLYDMVNIKLKNLFIKILSLEIKEI